MGWRRQGGDSPGRGRELPWVDAGDLQPDRAPEAGDEAGELPGKRLRILFLSHYFPPEGNAPASRVHEMCKRWGRMGHDVQVITCAPNAPAGAVYPGYRNRFLAREQIDGIEVLRVWTLIAANRGRLRRGLSFLSYLVMGTLAGLFVKRPDVVIATSPQFFCGLAGTCVSKPRRLPFLLEIRDIWPASIAAVGAMKKRVLLRLLEVLEHLMYRSATRIVTVGDGYREELAHRGVDPERVDVVTNGVDREIFEASTADGSAVRRDRQLDGSFVCSYVGTIGMACGLDVVLRAAQILSERGRSDVRFMLVGDGAVREELEGRVRTARLSNVQFTGRVDKADVPAYLAASDACLVHLRREALFKTVLPSKMFEAWAMGKPIVLGKFGHFGRSEDGFSWEVTDKAEALQSELPVAVAAH